MFVPLQHHYCPPYWARAWFWTHQACLARSVLQVMHSRSSFAPSECRGWCRRARGHWGRVLMWARTAGGLWKMLKVFGMSLRVPLRQHDPWHLLADPCALFCDLRTVRACGEILIQKFHSSLSCKSTKLSAHEHLSSAVYNSLQFRICANKREYMSFCWLL